jgi:hypothetical protein
MRLSLLSVMVVGGLLSVPVLHEAAAAPVTPATLQITPAMASGPIEKIYYYRGHSYPYYYHGGYYSYRYQGQYFRYRNYRNGRWHYY